MVWLLFRNTKILYVAKLQNFVFHNYHVNLLSTGHARLPRSDDKSRFDVQSGSDRPVLEMGGGTVKIFKKSAPNGGKVWYGGVMVVFLGRVYVYMGKREYVSIDGNIEPIQGVVYIQVKQVDKTRKNYPPGLQRHLEGKANCSPAGYHLPSW